MRKLVILLVLLVLIGTVSLAQVSVKQIAEVTLNTPSVTVYSVTPYDHGVVVTLSYTNVSLSNLKKAYSTLCIYFLNSTTKLLLYKSTLTGISFAYTFVENGKLYVVVDTTSSPAEEQAYVYVFQGLKLVNTFTVNKLLMYMKGADEPLYNLSALTIMSENIFPLSINVTIMLNNTNITLHDLFPVAELQLPSGILIVSANFSYMFRFGQTTPIPFNFTLFNYDGKIVWTKKYYLLNFPTTLFTIAEPLSTEVMLLDEGYATVIGDQLFISNITTRLLPFTPSNITLNETLLGINLENGAITTKINLTNVSLAGVSLINIGGKLYVVKFSKKEITLEEYNGVKLSTVAKIPLVVRVKEIKIGKISRNITETITRFFYNPNKYLLIVNPTPAGANVTDIYSGGIIHYTLDEKVVNYYIAKNVILLNESDNFSLAFLYNNGTVRGVVNIGNVSSPLIFGILRYPGVHVVEVNPYKYYVVKTYSDPGKTEVIVYEVTFQKPVTVTSTKSLITTTTKPPITTTVTMSTVPQKTSILPIIAGIAVAIVVVVAVILILKRRK